MKERYASPRLCNNECDGKLILGRENWSMFCVRCRDLFAELKVEITLGTPLWPMAKL